MSTMTRRFAKKLAWSDAHEAARFYTRKRSNIRYAVSQCYTERKYRMGKFVGMIGITGWPHRNKLKQWGRLWASNSERYVERLMSNEPYL